MAVSILDFGHYMAKQTGRGVPNTGAHRGVLHMTKYGSKRNIKEVAGEAALGSSMWIGPAAQSGFSYEWNAEGRMTMRRLPYYIFGMLGTLTTTDEAGGAGTPNRHRFTFHKWSADMPWFSMHNIYGQQSNIGNAIAIRALRDAKIQEAVLTYSTKDAMRFKQKGIALQEGLPSGTETYTSETVNIQPIITSPTHDFDYPADWAAFADDLCLNNMEIAYRNTIVESDPCADGNGEPSDILHKDARVEVKLGFQYNAAAEALYRFLAWKDAPAAGEAASRSRFRNGNFGFNLKSFETVGAGALDVPYEFGGFLPLQWKNPDVNRESGDFVTMEVMATTYEVNPTGYFEVLNGLTNAQMLGTAA